MLLQNYNVFNTNTGRAIGGPTNPTLSYKRSSCMNFYTGEAYVVGQTEKTSFNNGYLPPYTWILAPKSGGIAASTTVKGVGDIDLANLAGGLNAQSSLSGSGTISNAALGLILSAVATLSGTGNLSADIIGKLDAVATLAGNGSITASLGALASIVANLEGEGNISATPFALASMSADITVTGATLTTANVGGAVWNALAAAFNNPDTMGELLNASGGGSSPEIIADAVAAELAPLLNRLLATSTYFGNK